MVERRSILLKLQLVFVFRRVRSIAGKRDCRPPPWCSFPAGGLKSVFCRSFEGPAATETLAPLHPWGMASCWVVYGRTGPRQWNADLVRSPEYRAVARRYRKHAKLFHFRIF